MKPIRKFIHENLEVFKPAEWKGKTSREKVMLLMNKNNSKELEEFCNACCNDITSVRPVLSGLTQLYEGALRGQLRHELANIAQAIELQEKVNQGD